MSTFQDERVVISNVLDGLGVTKILWPDTAEDLPPASANPEAPVTYAVVERGLGSDTQVDFGGGRGVDAVVSVWLWVEKFSGEDGLNTLVESLGALFDAGDASGMYFGRRVLHPPLIGGTDGEWYGRRVDQHFARFT